MAARNEGCASIGCLGLVFLALIGMCSGDGSDNGSRSAYSPSYTPSYSTPAPVATTEPREWLYVHGPLNVRSAPNRSARVVRTLSRGDMVQLGAADVKGWARIYTGAAEDEYVYRASDLVRARPPAAPRPLAATGSGSRSGSSRGHSRRSGGGRQLHVGPRGGCYYINGNGNKTYVDRSECN